MPVVPPAHSGEANLRILFVGSSNVLSSDLIANVLSLVGNWESHQATNANDALIAVATRAFDAVVVAPDLPDMPCATLLGQIRTLRPETIRVALLDPSDQRDTLSARVISLAHRFLPLPPSPETLIEALISFEELRELLENPRLRSAVGRVEKLPSPPLLYQKLTYALDEDNSSDASGIAGLIASNPVITAKVLQLCNSALFSNGRYVNDLRAAVTRLGISTLRQLVLACEVFSDPSLTPAVRHALQRQALMSSRLAARILPSASAELGATAALLADIGLLLPSARNEHDKTLICDDARPGHTEAGAYLLGLWGLPMPIIEAVALQLQPQRSSTRSFWVTGAVHVATALVNRTPINEEYLAKTGMLAQLPNWQAQADALMGLAEEVA